MRVVLSVLAQLYDPLGSIAPVVVRGKILMQNLWREKVSWYQELPDAFKKDWQLLFDSLLDLSQILILRWNRFHPKIRESDLHGFANALIPAYGAVLYLCTGGLDGHVAVQLVASKTRVTPNNVI